MKNSLYYLIIFLAIGLLNPAQAEDEPRWYQIELIVLSNKNAQETISETWPASPGRPSEMDYVELVSPVTETVIETPRDPALTDPLIGEPTMAEPAPAEVMAQAAVTTPMDPANADISTDTALTSETNPAMSDIEPVVPFAILKQQDLRLGLSAEKITRSPDYDLLLHIGWRQPVFQPNENAAVYLHDSLNQVLDRINMLDSGEIPAQAPAQPGLTQAELELQQALQAEGIPAGENVFTDSPAMDSTVADDEEHGPQPQTLFGTFRLSLSRFLHIDMDLAYITEYIPPATQPDLVTGPVPDPELPLDTMPVTTGNETTNQTMNERMEEVVMSPEMDAVPLIREYRLQESRRIKPDEIHYFDHPAFGVIVMITRYELPKPEEEEPLMQPFLP